LLVRVLTVRGSPRLRRRGPSTTAGFIAGWPGVSAWSWPA